MVEAEFCSKLRAPLAKNSLGSVLDNRKLNKTTGILKDES